MFTCHQVITSLKQQTSSMRAAATRNHLRALHRAVFAVALLWGAQAPAQVVSGACGTVASTCATGTVTGSSDNGTSTSWTCLGNGGSNAWCTVADTVAAAVNGACGSVASTCTAGTVTGSTNNGISTSWTCAGSSQGTNSWCSVTDVRAKPVNGTCGATANTCAAGAVTGSTNNGISTSWTCLGDHNGTNGWCSVSNTAAAPVSTPIPTPVTPVTPVAPVSPVAPVAANPVPVSRTPVIPVSPSPVIPVAPTPVAPTPVAPTPVTPTPVTPTPPTTVASSNALAGSKLGINLGWVLDWSDREMMFVDIMKNGRGFAQPAHYWDATNYPVPVDANGWPTSDFGVVFLSNPADPLNRPLTSTFPSFFGTYSLSFTGQATVTGVGCCTIQNVNYNPQTNTTTASVVVGPSDTSLSLTFTGTNGGVQNVKLLRPGYAVGTTQVFTTQFLKAIAPFGTLRFMDTLQTNGSPVTTWAQRTQPNAPLQSGLSGLAWEYVFQLANTSGKDIWINIPQGVDLTDPTANNYATQLALLMKANLNPGIHVYLEYSNEVWNGAFPQSQANVNDAVSEVNSGADPTLNYDNGNNQWYWGSRRVVHQIVRISQLFRSVFGSAAMNTTIRPLYLGQYVQPFVSEDGLTYLKTNFGDPSQFIYGMGAAPYFSTPTNAYSDVPGVVAGLGAGLTSVMSGFQSQAYGGGVVYSNVSFKGLADYYGLKSVSYEGGPDLSSSSNAYVNAGAEDASALTSMVESYLSQWYGCGNDLFMYFDLAEPRANVYGTYEDLSLATPKSIALTTVAATPLSSYSTCAAP